MRRIENALPPVVELSEEEHHAGHEEADVRSRNYDFGPLANGGKPEFVHEFFGFFQVLDDVEHHDLFESGDVHRELWAVEIPANKVNSARGTIGGILIHS